MPWTTPLGGICLRWALRPAQVNNRLPVERNLRLPVTTGAGYSDLREAMSMEKRYFTSDLSSRS